MNIVSAIICIAIIEAARYLSRKYRQEKLEKAVELEDTVVRSGYRIVAPELLKWCLPSTIFFAFCTAFYIFSTIFQWEFVSHTPLDWLLITIFFLFAAVSGIVALYGYVWRIDFDESEVRYRSFYGVTKCYQIAEITKYTEKRHKQYKFYSGTQKLFQYETDAEGDGYDLPFLLKKRGLEAEELIPSRKEHCIVEETAIRKAFPLLLLMMYIFVLFIILESGGGPLWSYIAIFVVMLGLLYTTGKYWCDRIEASDKIYRREFLKPQRIVEFSQVRGIEERKKDTRTYYLIEVEGEKPIKVWGHNENVHVFLGRVEDEIKKNRKAARRQRR